MSINQLIERIEELDAAATKGPWHRSRNWHIIAEGHDWDRCWLAKGITLDNYDPSYDKRVAHIMGPGQGNNAAGDFDFIPAARTLLPACAKLLRIMWGFANDGLPESMLNRMHDEISDELSKVAISDETRAE